MIVEASNDLFQMELPRQPSISVSIPASSLIINEIITIVTAMRKHSRWASSGVAAILGGAVEANIGQDQQYNLSNRWGLRGGREKVVDSPLMAGFSKLRKDLLNSQDIASFDTTALLQPFLAVIHSSSTTGFITSLALNAIQKFFSYRIITRTSTKLPEAMRMLSSAVTHCRFEASDSGQDEVVLLRILTLMEEMMSGVGGELLGDESVCEMMEIGLSICCQTRLSEILRRSAEMAMLKMVQVVFERLKGLDPTDEGNDFDNISMDRTTSSDVRVEDMGPEQGQVDIIISEFEHSRINGDPMTSVNELDIEPYGIVSTRELLRVLITILDPHSRQHTDTMRVMALRIIEVAFEVGGDAIGSQRSLRRLATDNLCRFLFQLVRSDNHVVLQSSLRVISTLLHTMRVHLKLQQELFLNYVVACLVPKAEALRESGIDPSVIDALPLAPKLKQLNSGRSTPVPIKERQRLGLEGGSRGNDAREVMIECIGSLARIPTFMVDLFVNYDCQEDMSDLCEDVIGFLSRNAFPDAAIWSTTNVPPLCLDALLGYISFIASRTGYDPSPDMNLPDPAQLALQRARKEVIVKGSSKFNEDPKLGIQFLKEHGIISVDGETISLAKFLVGSSRINKTLLGDFLSRPKNIELLRAFIDLFDFCNKRLDEALREMLQKFRLPGEAQQIDRIVEEFGKWYFEANPDEVANSDAAYVLSYAVIMLNTDQHNPQAKKTKMTAADFAKNLRGTNESKDFRPEYLQNIYEAIRTNEIIMPEEHDTSTSFDYAWKELCTKANSAGDLTICSTNIYDEHMFRATWKPLIATLAYVFSSATDDAVFSRVITGFSQCAAIASHYRISEAMDNIILSLSKLTIFASETLPRTDLNTSVEVDHQKVTISEMSVSFGRDFKAQLATVVLFNICKGNEAVIRDGWDQLFHIFSALLINSLLPISFSPIHQFLQISPIPLPPPSRSSKRTERNREASFLTSLSSYLSSYASDEPAEPSDNEIEATMCTNDCVTSCRLDLISTNMMNLPLDTSSHLVTYLLSSEADSPTRKALTPLRSSSPTIQEKGMDIIYDPASLLKLEIAVTLTMRNPESLTTLSSNTLRCLMNLIDDPTQQHPIVTERILIYLLRLLKELFTQDITIDHHDVLGKIASLDDSILKHCAVPISFGILECLRLPSAVGSPLRTNVVYDLMRRLKENADAAPLVFQTVSLLSGPLDSEEQLHFLLNILSDFATVGDVGYIDEKAAEAARRAKQTPPEKKFKEETQRSCRAIDLIYQLRTEVTIFIQNMTDIDNDHVWQDLWKPILSTLQKQCKNPCREIRQYAYTFLQRFLLSVDFAPEDQLNRQLIYPEILLPLISDLLSSDANKIDANGVVQARGQAASVLCKIWLNDYSVLSHAPNFVDTWISVLMCLGRLIASGNNGYLTEGVSESLKNVLLVMNSSNVLVLPTPESTDRERELWRRTAEILDERLPKLKDEIFPPVTDMSDLHPTTAESRGVAVGA